MAQSSHIAATRRRGDAKWPVNACRLRNDCARRYGEIAQLAAALAGSADWGGPFPFRSARGKAKVATRWQLSRLAHNIEKIATKAMRPG